MPDEMRDDRTVRIDPLVFGHEADAGQTEAMNFSTLLGRDLTLEQGEAAFGGKPFAHLRAIDVRHHRCEQLDRFIIVLHAAWLGECFWYAELGLQDLDQ